MDTLRRPPRLRVSYLVVATVAFVVAGTCHDRRTLTALTNPIVAENERTGTPQSVWDLHDPGGSGDPTIQGFATDISVNVGDPVTFKIKLGVGVPGYAIDIYRLGYYQGNGARFIATLTPTPLQIADSLSQPACVTEPVSGLVDCGNWKVSGQFDTDGLTSGIFIARPRRTDTGGASHIVFIVRDDARRADMLFQTSDATWQAYNTYPGTADGGSSLYCNPNPAGGYSSAAGDYSCARRSAKVSYNRPFDTRDHDKLSWLFNAEYPMLRWLEANGYDVKYWSGVDTDRLGADENVGLRSLVAPRAFLSVGHDEYWSGNQRTNVEEARDSGVHLAFFSGNEMFWKTRYEPSIDGSNTAYRTLVSYKESFTLDGNRVDPVLDAPATATWRDPRFGSPLDGSRPENALTGQLWTVNCCSDRILVPSEFSKLRFWRNTNVATLLPGENYVTPMQTLGYEWDEDVDNGWRPDGMVRLSSTTVNVDQKAAGVGIKVFPGVATHALTLYRHPSGALVFGAGTVHWSYGLDSAHDELPTPPDRAMQQATVNLFADMGIQPLTLQNGADNQPLHRAEKSSDTDPPTATITFPSPGSTVPSGSRVTVTGSATDLGGVVAGVEISVDEGLTWHAALMPSPTAFSYAWQVGAIGQATIRARAIDDSGNLDRNGSATIVEVGAPICPCTSLWPASATPAVPSALDPAAVELGLKFTSDVNGFITGARFYKGPANTGTHTGSLWTAAGERMASATFVEESATGWQQVLFPAPVAITANTVYVVSYHTTSGGYAADGGYLSATGVDSPPLHALPNAAAAGNGVFSYSLTPTFPTNSSSGTNYWVDVVFSPSATDTTPPVITAIKSTIVDSSRVNITWTTNEPSTSKILYATDPSLLTDTSALPPGTVTISQPAFVLSHAISVSGLSPNTTYYYRVVSADRSGNAADVAAPNFTLPGPTLRDTSSADFAAGSGLGAYVSESGDGEVMPAPSIGTEFRGTSLDPGWTAVAWDAGGTASLLNGTLVVNGARVGTCQASGTACPETPTLSPGHRVDFVATFSGDPFQHGGLGQNLDGGPWAIFSTGDGTTLFAKSLTSGGVAVNTAIPGGAAYFGAPHHYAIDWQTEHVDYYVDGAHVASHALAVQGPMRPVAASDFGVFGGNIVVDWTRVSPYPLSAAFESRVFDASASVDWHTIQWSQTTPPGTSVRVSLRTGNTKSPDETWTAWQPVAAAGALTLRSQFIQYRADLSTSDVTVAPSLDDIIISTGRAPIAVNDAIFVALDTVTTIPASGGGSLVANDLDPDGDALAVAAVGPASHGTVVLREDGTVRYTPQAGYIGPDSFAYVASDGLFTSTATVAIGVHVGNLPPSFVKGPDQTVFEDAAARSIAGWATAISAGGPGETGQVVDFQVSADNPALFSAQPAVSASGTLTFTPAHDANGVATVTVRAHDDGGTLGGGIDTSVPQTFTIAILPVNDPPRFAKGIDPRVPEDSGPQSILKWATAISAGPADEIWQTVSFAVGTSRPDLFTTAGQPAIDPNGTLTFAPAPNANGSTVVTVSLRDSGGTADGGVDTSAAQTFVIEITAVNDNPIAQDDALTLPEDSAATPINVLANDNSGPDTGETLSVTAVTPPAHGTATFTATGVSYKPLANYNGPDSFTYTIGDGNGGTASAKVTLTVTPVNDNPTANADTLTVAEDSPATTVDVLANDSIAPDTGETLVIKSVTQGAHGTVTMASLTATSVSYQPAANYNGPDTFTYTISDGNGGFATATVTVTVTPVNDNPTANADTLIVAEDSPATTVDVLANDSIAPDTGETLVITAVTQGAHGSVTIGSLTATSLSYQPAANYTGPDTFTYTIRDGNGGFATATVKVTVTPVNDDPVATADAATVLEDSQANTVNVLVNDNSGPDTGETLTVTSVAVPLHGTASFTPTGISYTPTANYNGPDSLTYTIADGNGGSARANVSVTVTAVNDAPSFVKGADQSSAAGAGPQAVPAWATAITAGPADEAAQALTFAVTTDNAALFSAQPSIAANGTLTYAPAATGGGVAHVTVTLKDNGGVANGGVDTSAPAMFSIALPFPTTTTLVSPTASPTTYGQAVVLNATVSSTGGVPTGWVDFTDNGILLGHVALVNGGASLTTAAIGAGTARTVKAVYQPAVGFLASEASITRAVTAVATTSTFAATPPTVQYSDVVTVETTLTPGNLGGTLPAQQAQFKIGTLVVGTANFVWDAAAGVARARYTGPLVEPTFTATGGALKPGSKTVTITYLGVSPNYTVANKMSSMSITREDAAVAYAGDTNVVCTACSAVAVQLRARVSDIDASVGDLRNATVSFVNRTTGLTIATVAVAADGTASTTWTVNLGTATTQTTKIGMVVGGYYIRSNTLDDGTVVISKQ